MAVGIISAHQVTIDFIKGFDVKGVVKFDADDFHPVRFEPSADDSVFEIKDVVIGIGFHWERCENQRFSGAVELLRDENGRICVVNHVLVEEYIKSVISSEMSATSSPELLKAHAVISRSWVMAQIGNKDSGKQLPDTKNQSDEIIRWYDREQHSLFDVCADDHCQRYQGLTRQTSPNVEAAVSATRGTVLTFDGILCDARFSKCCGGAIEEFQFCWEDKKYPYLKAKTDIIPETHLPDFTDESNAFSWISSRPDAFCNTTDARILSQVLNNYDRETSDFYRWKVSYNSRELGELILKKSGIYLGDIIDMIPLARGASARIYRLKIVGSKKTVIVGKELEIRRWLSESHLYSSAFIVEKSFDENGDLFFTLCGAGWGHGVGLCQIGAAVMGERGYDYRQILSHYYPGSNLTKVY